MCLEDTACTAQGHRTIYNALACIRSIEYTEDRNIRVLRDRECMLGEVGLWLLPDSKYSLQKENNNNQKDKT